MCERNLGRRRFEPNGGEREREGATGEACADGCRRKVDVAKVRFSLLLGEQAAASGRWPGEGEAGLVARRRGRGEGETDEGEETERRERREENVD